MFLLLQDAFAILLAAHHPNLDVLGISTVHGNASLRKTTINAGSILTAIGKSEIPVYPGAASPFCRIAVHAPDIHGSSGLDGTTHLPSPSVPVLSNSNAILAIYSALIAEPPGTAWLVATGALTNVAVLFAAFPDLAGHIRGLSIMGGAIGGGFTDAPMGTLRGEGERFGNVTRWAEFNIYCDPEAAQSIFINPILASKTTLIPLDLTHQVLATREVQLSLLHGSGKPLNTPKSSSSLSTPHSLPSPSSKSTSSPAAESKAEVKAASPSPFPLPTPSTTRLLFYELLLFFASTYARVFNITAGPPLHDPLAVAIVLFDEGIDAALAFDDRSGERWAVDVVTDGAHGGGGDGTQGGEGEKDDESGQVGRTVARAVEVGKGGVRIPRGLNVDRFWAIVDDCLGRAEERISRVNKV
ncbi:Uridine nucleosidase 1 [Agyrium rufum]|nr:Uridine nucleosidase 1 [Agyrium rufum]